MLLFCIGFVIIRIGELGELFTHKQLFRLSLFTFNRFLLLGTEVEFELRPLGVLLIEIKFSSLSFSFKFLTEVFVVVVAVVEFIVVNLVDVVSVESIVELTRNRDKLFDLLLLNVSI